MKHSSLSGLVASLLLLVTAVAHGQQTITLLGSVNTSGEIKSVAPGVIVVTDSAGKDTEFKIQGKGEDGVSLGGAAAVIKFPATVEVSGTFTTEALTRGTLVRFSGRLNRLGRTEDSVEEILVFDEGAYPLGVEVDSQPAEAGGYGTCTITGEAYSLRNNRLIVTTPKNEYVRSPRLAFALAEDVSVKLQSKDLGRVKPGDKVVRLLAARFSTGDTVIKELSIELAQGTAQAGTPKVKDINRYRHLSDQPGKPRDLRSAHFMLHTDISDRSAKILLDKLETMIALVSQYYGRLPARIIECYVVRDLGNWPQGTIPPEAVAKISGPAGITLSISLGRLTRSVVYACDKHGVVQHEAIHAYCAQTFGSTGPTWYSEGMAEMGQYWKKDQPAVEVDPVVIDYLKKAPPKSMLDIVAAGQITGDSWRAYAWRWALCHLLANNPNYSGRLKALGIGMMTEQPGASFESVYGPVAREISFEYDQFVKHLDNGYRADLCAWQWNRKFQFVLGTRYSTAKPTAKYGWQASGVKLQNGQSYDYVAQGTWKVSANGDEVDANGHANGNGRLAGVIMRDFQLGEPMDLGAKGTFVAPHVGDLYLRCQDAWNSIADNDGSITVYFRRTPSS